METIFHTAHFMNASECNAQKQISLPLLVQRLIEVATDHATELGVGYSDLRRQNLAWVLSRLTLEMKTYPAINCHYCIDTWVASINRHYTERCFHITDDEGNTLGCAHTVWVAIDLATRRGGDMSAIMAHVSLDSQPVCTIFHGKKLQSVMTPDYMRNHRFGFCDIDFNRHVNSTRYIEAMLNDDRTVHFYDQHMISRFEIAYMDEIRFNDNVEIKRETIDNVANYEILRDGRPMTRARITYSNYGTGSKLK